MGWVGGGGAGFMASRSQCSKGFLSIFRLFLFLYDSGFLLYSIVYYMIIDLSYLCFLVL